MFANRTYKFFRFSVKSALLFLVIFLVACSPSSDVGSTTGPSSLKECEDLYKNVFLTEFHDFTRTAPRTCTNCHDTPSTSHEFALLDGDASFENFLLMSSLPSGSGQATDAKNLLRARALDSMHYSSGSSAYITELNSFEAAWNAVTPTYNICVNSL